MVNWLNIGGSRCWIHMKRMSRALLELMRGLNRWESKLNACLNKSGKPNNFSKLSCVLKFQMSLEARVWAREDVRFGHKRQETRLWLVPLNL